MPTADNEPTNGLITHLQANGEAFHTNLDRVLSSVEKVQEKVDAQEAWIEFLRQLGWGSYLVVGMCMMVLLFAMLDLMFDKSGYKEDWKGWRDRVQDVNLNLLVPIAVLVAILGWNRYFRKIQTAHARDRAYASRVADLLRENLTPSFFPSKLEFHLFRMRLSRFDISAEGRSPRTQPSPVNPLILPDANFTNKIGV